MLKSIVGVSFVFSARDADLIDIETSAATRAMQWQVDFRKLKESDEFSVPTLYETLDGECEQNQLLGVRLRFDDKDYYVIHIEDGKLHDRNGTELTKDFMRFPAAHQFRVSSNLNPCRLNSATGHVTPHRGVDSTMS